MTELSNRFPDEKSAVNWVESVRWPDGIRQCPHCQCKNTYVVKSGKPMPYRCRICKKYFSVRKGTIYEDSPLPLRKWVFAIYLVTTSLKGVSSMKLHREIKVSQPTAWYMLRRIRETFNHSDDGISETLEVDDTYIGWKRTNINQIN